MNRYRWLATVGWLGLWLWTGPVAARTTDEGAWQVEQTEQTLTVRQGGQVVAVYRQTAHPFKPYLQELYTPGGLQPLLDSPSDHIHHHAVMYAVSADGKTFWNEYRYSKPGWQKPRPGQTRWQVLPGRGVRLSQVLDWVDCDGVKRLVEERQVVLEGRLGGATVATWRSTLQVPPGREQVKLSGAHYEGLGMRFIRQFDGRATFVHQGGKPGPVFRGDERLTPGRWCAVHGTVNGKPVTAAMFDGPANPRPAVWFTMAKPFAYLSATIALHERPMTLEAGQNLQLCYGMAVWDGHVDAGVIEKTCRQWLARAAGPAAPAGPGAAR